MQHKSLSSAGSLSSVRGAVTERVLLPILPLVRGTTKSLFTDTAVKIMSAAGVSCPPYMPAGVAL